MKFNGRPPKPRALRVLQGNPGRRPLPPETLKPPSGAAPPGRLNAAARREWRRIAPVLLGLGLLTKIDRAALAVYCDAYAIYRRAMDRLEQDGDLITAANGTLIPHPSVAIAFKAMETVRRFTAEFGFTPAARMRVEGAIAKESEDEDDKQFFQNPFQATPADRARR